MCFYVFCCCCCWLILYIFNKDLSVFLINYFKVWWWWCVGWLVTILFLKKHPCFLFLSLSCSLTDSNDHCFVKLEWSVTVNGYQLQLFLRYVADLVDLMKIIKGWLPSCRTNRCKHTTGKKWKTKTVRHFLVCLPCASDIWHFRIHRVYTMGLSGLSRNKKREASVCGDSLFTLCSSVRTIRN